MNRQLGIHLALALFALVGRPTYAGGIFSCRKDLASILERHVPPVVPTFSSSEERLIRDRSKLYRPDQKIFLPNQIFRQTFNSERGTEIDFSANVEVRGRVLLLTHIDLFEKNHSDDYDHVADVTPKDLAAGKSLLIKLASEAGFDVLVLVGNRATGARHQNHRKRLPTLPPTATEKERADLDSEARTNPFTHVIHLTRRTAQTAQATDTSWERFADDWKQGFEQRLNEHLPQHGKLTDALAKAYLAGDPRIQGYETFGFRFDPHTGGLTYIPDLQHILKVYEEQLQDLLREGRLTEAQTMRPGRAFRKGDGEFVFLKYPDEPEKGWTEFDVSNDPDLVGKMFGLGIFPISRNERGHHDFSHMLGLIHDPGYMAGIRQMVDAGQPNQNRARGIDLHLRIFFAYENLSLVPSSKRAALQALLPKPFHGPRSRGRIASLFGQPQWDPDRLVTVEEVNSYYASTPQEELKRQAKQLLERLPHLVEHYGGSSREVGVTYSNEELEDSIDVLQDRLRRQLRFGDTKVLRYDLARLQVALWESTRLTAREFIEQSLQARPTPDSALHRMFVQSGIGEDHRGYQTLMSLSISGNNPHPKRLTFEQNQY